MKVRSPNTSEVREWRLMKANSSVQKKLDPLRIRVSSIWPRTNDCNCGFSTNESILKNVTFHDQLREPIEAVGSDLNSLERIAISDDANSLLFVLDRKARRG